MNNEFQLPDIFLLPDDIQNSYNCYPGIDRLKNYADLSEEAKKLTEKIYDFINKHNTQESQK